jgi:enolase-phosphatase E1
LVSAVLLDIEGTTSPIQFVYNVLFPYAAEHLRSFLEENSEDSEVSNTIDLLYEEYEQERDACPAWFSLEDLEGAASYMDWLMEQDRKSTALKAIQGLIWKSGFENGELKGEVFPDVPPALVRWKKAGTDVYIFSSGSILAQQLMFRYSSAGDLSHYLSGYFDTTTGSKRERVSYKRIADKMCLDPSDVLFISDVAEELTAAHEAGMEVKLSIRPGNKPTDSEGFETVTDFGPIQ